MYLSPKLIIMTRTFHTKLSKKTLFLCLLPSTVMAIYFFWIKWPLIAFIFIIFMVIIIERLIHTAYIITSDDKLIIFKGRFSQSKTIPLSDIRTVEHIKPSSVNFMTSRDIVCITLKNGGIKLISPFPANDFCNYINKKIHEKN